MRDIKYKTIDPKLKNIDAIVWIEDIANTLCYL